MQSTRRTATVVGALFLLAMVASLVGGGLIEGVIGGSDLLAKLGSGSTALGLGVILELINALAVVGIAVAVFPIFRRDNEGAALGYVAVRILEAVTLTAAAFLPIALLGMSRTYAQADAASRPSLEVLASQLVDLRAGLAGVMVPLFFCLGAVLLYTWLYRTRLLPRFIPVWGLLGVVGIAILNLVDVGQTVAMILALPMILNELFLGGWLLIRGFGEGRTAPRAAVPAD